MGKMFIYFVVVYFGSVQSMLKDAGDRLPMIDGNKRPLTVDLDLTDFNKKVEKIVEEDLPEEITEKFERYINSSRFQDGIRNTFEELMKVKIDEIISKSISNLDSKVQGMETRLQKQISSAAKDRPTYAFFAALSSSKSNLRSGSVLVFDSVQLNSGGHYDAVTGKYTCPESGIYTFSWTTISIANKDFTSQLMVNSRAIATNAVDNDSTQDSMTGSVTVVVQMQKHEQAWIKVTTGDYVDKWTSVSNTVFSGYRIQ